MFGSPALPSAGALSVAQAQFLAGTPVDILAQEGYERIQQPLYSLQAVASTATSTQFFASVPTDVRVGNIERANTLPKPQMFYGRGIAFALQPAAALADVQLLARSGVFLLTVNQRLQFQFPVNNLGNGGGVYSATTTNATLGFPSLAFAYYFEVPFILQGEEHFTAVVQWPLTIAGLSATTDVQLVFLGLLFRKMTGQ